jgi:type IV fimbrial biogenesis protein FimT
MLKRRSAQRGFSIIEVLVGIAIVSLMLGVVAPQMSTWVQNTQLRSAAESISSGIQLARVEALRRNTHVAFELTSATSTAWHICLFDPIGNACTGTDISSRPAKEAGETMRAGVDTTGTTDPASAIAGGTAVPALVAFDPLGRIATTSPTNIRRVDIRNPNMSTGERRLVVLVSPGGQVRMCDPGLSLSANPQGCA